MGRLYDARPESLPGDGAHHGTGLQLVDGFHATGHSREARRGDYFTAASVARHRAPDAAWESNQGGGHQHAFQSAGNRRGPEQGERVSPAHQGDCGAVVNTGEMATDSQRRLPVFSPRQGAGRYRPTGRSYRLTAVFRIRNRWTTVGGVSQGAP